DCDINGNVVLDEDKTCQAIFGQPGVPLYLTVVKYGKGNILSQPSGIECGIDCKKFEHEFPGGKPVKLAAIPDEGWKLEGWRGHCDDTGNVTILHDYTTCRAFFVEDPNSIPTYGEELTEAVHGGEVTSTILDYPDGTSKILFSATPESEDYALVGWDGDNCAGNTDTIIVTVGTDCKPIFALDNDHDGTADMVENAAPNNGDGNNDSIPDSQQNNVISVPNASGNYITTEVNSDCKVNDVQLDSDITTFDLDCEEATAINYYHGISGVDNNPDNQMNIQGKSVTTENFTLTTDSSGKSIRVNTIFSGQVQLSSSSYVIKETDQTAKITVLRKNGCDGRITVDYNAQSETATQNIDYLLKYGSLTWEDNDCSDKSFDIIIFDDTDEEDVETIQINLLNAKVTEPFEADLTIIDDDSLVTAHNGDLNDTFSQDSEIIAENTIGIIDTTGEQTIYLTVGQTKIFTVLDAMVFVKQLPDLQLVLTTDLKSFDNGEGELSLTGLNVGETEMTISNQDYSQEATVKIVVTTELDKINLGIQPEINLEVQPITKCDKPNALAISSTGQSINSDSCFISILNNVDQSVKRKLEQHQNVRITSKIFIDSQDVDKIANFLLVAKYTNLQKETVWFNRGHKIWQIWDDNKLDNLLTAQEHPLLPEIVNVFIFEGSLGKLAGEFTVFIGYRLIDGTVVFNGLEPLNFSVK
ncbi:MAG: hypothetical protein IMF12_05705, partial [Proteobacteria bacterium]|nr:hypothetical protein [Pseudomonadota bacterium]